MARPKFAAPRSHLESGKFGAAHQKKDNPLRWHQPKSISALCGLRAAEIQHHFAIETRKRVGGDGRTYASAAEKMMFDYSRFIAILNGRAHLSLRDAALIEATYGPILHGLDFEHVLVEDVGLRTTYPNAIGMAPLKDRFDPRR